jgi:hypothetical protein
MRIVFQVCFALMALLTLSLDAFADDVPSLTFSKFAAELPHRRQIRQKGAVQIWPSTIASKVNRLSEAK